MYAKTALLDCGPVFRLARDPSGHFLSGSIPAGGSLLVSTRSFQWEHLPYLRMGPWSPQGDRVLVEDEEGCWVMSWPERKRLFRLPQRAWLWLDHATLVAVHGGCLWTHDFSQPHLSHEDPDGRWKKLIALDHHKAIGLRWRPSLKETELTIWQGDRHPLSVPRFPDLGDMKPGIWAWNESKTGWACAGGSQGRHLRAWSFPQGWITLEHETQHRILSLELSEEALFWIDHEGLHTYQLESHALGFHAIPAIRWPGTVLWLPKHQQLVAAGLDGLHLFQPGA